MQNPWFLNIWIEEQNKDTNLQNRTKRAQTMKKARFVVAKSTWRVVERMLHCQKFQCAKPFKKTKLVSQRSSRPVAKWFHDGVLESPKLQTLRFMNAKAEGS